MISSMPHFPKPALFTGHHKTSPNSEYFGDTAFYLSHDLGYRTQYCAPSTPYGSDFIDGESVPTFSLSSTQASSTVSSELMAAINLYSGESAAQIDNNLFRYTDKFLIGEPHDLAKVEPISLSLPPSPQSDVSTSVNGARMYNSNHEPPMDFLSPPSSEANYSLPQSIIVPLLRGLRVECRFNLTNR
ncbi:hypothetical protein BDP27DRAFT_876865 [Rhodocollybia butyracea]|uniref:Uncharacterized protein n=1 Tax=Rhodocollybia butyracea TaxID=206335 RepID=A0A9P5TW43_9AGAR|nr:hypothetical protein BDP27DRAFT_876865 [Rhodocollybia butyracea]